MLISQNVNVKYATTMKAAFGMSNFWGLMKQILAILEKMVAEIL
jgi:hypothetical protein